MSEALTFQDNSWRQALVTHALWVRLVIGTLIIYLVAESLHWEAILALLVRSMRAFAFSLHL